VEEGFSFCKNFHHAAANIFKAGGQKIRSHVSDKATLAKMKGWLEDIREHARSK